MTEHEAATLQDLLSGVQAAQAPAPRFVGADGARMADPVLDELVFSLLVWEAGEARAAVVPPRLIAAFVDLNDLRIALPDELAAAFGAGLPRAAERADRMIAVLGDIVRRGHTLDLSHLPSLGKREARAYLDSLDGIPPFVAARVALLTTEAHAMPIDARLARLLERGGLVAPGASAAALSSSLERHVRASEAGRFYRALEAWADAQPRSAGASRTKPEQPPRAKRSRSGPRSAES